MCLPSAQLEDLVLRLFGCLDRPPPATPLPSRAAVPQTSALDEHHMVWHLKDSDERADGFMAGERLQMAVLQAVRISATDSQRGSMDTTAHQVTGQCAGTMPYDRVLHMQPRINAVLILLPLKPPFCYCQSSLLTHGCMQAPCRTTSCCTCSQGPAQP